MWRNCRSHTLLVRIWNGGKQFLQRSYAQLPYWPSIFTLRYMHKGDKTCLHKNWQINVLPNSSRTNSSRTKSHASQLMNVSGIFFFLVLGFEQKYLCLLRNPSATCAMPAAFFAMGYFSDRILRKGLTPFGCGQPGTTIFLPMPTMCLGPLTWDSMPSLILNGWVKLHCEYETMYDSLCRKHERCKCGMIGSLGFVKGGKWWR
jgi:hypothetical protein